MQPYGLTKQRTQIHDMLLQQYYNGKVYILTRDLT